MSSKEINKEFEDVISKWRAADSQRMIFGVEMLQTRNAIEELAESLKTIHKTYPSFSLVEKDGTMEIIIKANSPKAIVPTTAHIPINLPSLPKVFKEIKINSVTIDVGTTEEELHEFFRGVSLQVRDLESQGGLRGYLQSHGVTHIKVDQMKFQLLNEEEQIITDKSNINKIISTIKGTGEKAVKKDTKLQNAIWKDLISGKLETKDFKNDNQGLVDAASLDPKQLEKVLKRMATKQKHVDRFLANLEQKLSDVGLPETTITDIKKKLHKPKKVMIAEDELARLRKIDKANRKTAEKRTDDSLKSVKTIKKKLNDVTARSEAMLRQLSQGGVVLDKKGNVLSINKTAQNIIGCSEKEVHGKNVKKILKPHHSMTSVSDWQKETEAHTPKDVKIDTLKNETLAIIRESTIILENENGQTIGMVSALHNVTQQEDLNRRKNDILDVLGHDLRAPLGAIKQNFDVLVASTNLNEICDDKQKKFLDNCKNNIARLGNLIEKIMDTRQLETGKIILKYDTIDINNLLEEAVNSLTEWAQNKGINLVVAGDKMPNIDGDPERLYQVITNLISNALKFTPEEGAITVAVKSINNKGNEFVEISVKDSGLGIDKEGLNKIFDKYEQVTVNSPAGVSGLGLGLSICKSIVELHGGSISADSELEKGSTFTFRVPVKTTQ